MEISSKCDVQKRYVRTKACSLEFPISMFDTHLQAEPDEFRQNLHKNNALIHPNIPIDKLSNNRL
jgi:hypothetical protein